MTVILESHGDFVDSPTLKEVLGRAEAGRAALGCPSHICGWPGAARAYRGGAGRLDPAHTLEGLDRGGTDRKYVLTGKGDVPVERQVLAPRKMGYRGYYRFECEKHGIRNCKSRRSRFRTTRGSGILKRAAEAEVIVLGDMVDGKDAEGAPAGAGFLTWPESAEIIERHERKRRRRS